MTAASPGTLPTSEEGRQRSARGPVDPRLWQRAQPTRRYLVLAVAVGTATAILVVAQAWLLSTAVGQVFEGHSVEAAVLVAPWLAVVFGGRAVLSWLSTHASLRAAAAVKSQLRLDLVRSRLERPTAPESTMADLVLTSTTGLDALDGYFGRYLPALVLAVTVPLVVGVAILSADWVSAVVVALTLPLIPVFMVLVGWLTQTVVGRRRRVQSRLAHHFADLVAGLPTLQVFGRARAQVEGLRRTGQAHRSETMDALRISFLSALVLELLAALSVAVVAVGIGLRVVDGHLDLTTALFVLMLAPEAYLPLRQVGSAYHDSADGVAAAERAFALIDASPGPEGGLSAPDLQQATVELTSVSVRYPGASTNAVTDLDLTLRPGEVVVLTGPSGGGKSTALSVLLGFAQPTSGSVRVGGHDLAEVSRDQWLARLAWVPQSPQLLPGTVADNVALGPSDAPRGRIRRALDLAGGRRLELDHQVAAGTEGLSSGEVRRVALARALLRVELSGAQLLVMDEPTAGLDEDTEAAAIAGVRQLGVGAVIVSHRPAVLAAADRVVQVGRSAVTS
ncbi:MAG: thiol reductant ABC exporter subunit CydD [Propionibacteriaceae bacterium]